MKSTKGFNNINEDYNFANEAAGSLKGVKEYRDGLTPEKIPSYYPWLLKAKFKDAVLGINREGKLYWYDGTWISGTWEDGTWNGGIWFDGIWEFGIWKSGIWKSGTWISGTWEYGEWQNGEWEVGKKETGLKVKEKNLSLK